MNVMVRLKLEMAARVRDFLRSYPLEGLGIAAAVAWFDALLARASGHSTQQQQGVVVARSSTQRRAELKDLLRNSLLRHVAGVGVVAAKEKPELTSLFRMPSLSTHLSFVTAAARVLAEAEAHKDFLVSKGMEETTIDDLKKALAELEAVDVGGRNARADHVGAGADLEAVVAEIMDQVKLLDGTVRYRFRDNPEALAAWKSARSVPIRGRKAKPEAPGTTIPPVTGEAAA